MVLVTDAVRAAGMATETSSPVASMSAFRTARPGWWGPTHSPAVRSPWTARCGVRCRNAACHRGGGGGGGGQPGACDRDRRRLRRHRRGPCRRPGRARPGPDGRRVMAGGQWYAPDPASGLGPAWSWQRRRARSSRGARPGTELTGDHLGRSGRRWTNVRLGSWTRAASCSAGSPTRTG